MKKEKYYVGKRKLQEQWDRILNTGTGCQFYENGECILLYLIAGSKLYTIKCSGICEYYSPRRHRD